MTTIGKNIIEGMINGIRNKAGALFNKVAEIGNKIKNKIKDALKIGSPSKVTYQYSAWTTEGFINGLDSLKKQLYGTFDDMFQLSPSLYGSTSNNLSPNINVINNIDKNVPVKYRDDEALSIKRKELISILIDKRIKILEGLLNG